MKKSILYALIAYGYITSLVTIINFNKFEDGNEIVTGITVLSIFVFSAALMGYLFLSQPLLLFLEGKKDAAVRFFIETLLTFGSLVVLSLLIATFI